jgi:hypothetical protein
MSTSNPKPLKCKKCGTAVVWEDQLAFVSMTCACSSVNWVSGVGDEPDEGPFQTVWAIPMQSKESEQCPTNLT